MSKVSTKRLKTNDTIIEFSILPNGNLHHPVEPALQEFNRRDMKCLRREWYIDGRLHRDGDKPAMIRWYDNGVLYRQLFSVNGNIHRAGNPALVEYDYKGRVTLKSFYEDGEKHNFSYPAEIVYSYDQAYCEHERWFIYGKEVNVDDFPSIDFSNYPLSPDEQLLLRLSFHG